MTKTNFSKLSKEEQSCLMNKAEIQSSDKEAFQIAVSNGWIPSYVDEEGKYFMFWKL